MQWLRAKPKTREPRALLATAKPPSVRDHGGDASATGELRTPGDADAQRRQRLARYEAQRVAVALSFDRERPHARRRCPRSVTPPRSPGRCTRGSIEGPSRDRRTSRPWATGTPTLQPTGRCVAGVPRRGGSGRSPQRAAVATSTIGGAARNSDAKRPAVVCEDGLSKPSSPYAMRSPRSVGVKVRNSRSKIEKMLP